MATNRNTGSGGANPQSQRIKKSIMKRVKWLYVIFTVLGIMVFGMILVIQYGPNGAPLRNRSDEKCYKVLEVPASRGNIYSYEGNVMATDSPSYHVSLDFTVLDMADTTFQRQARMLADSLHSIIPEYSRDFFHRRLTEIRAKAIKGGPGSRNQTLIKSKVNQLQLDRMRNFPIFNKGRLGGGFIYRQDPERYKPYGTLAARTIGKPGEFGLEASFDSILSGSDGRNMCVRLVRDVWVPTVDKINVEVENGLDIVTTINTNMQDIVESELRKQILQHDALCGTAVIMEVETGAIRAISNLTRHGNTVRDDENHAIMMRTEPGSTFKLVSLMALLEEAGYDINTPVDCTTSGRYNYQYRTGGRQYLVADSHPVGKTTIQGMFEESSNIGFVKVVDAEYRDKPERFTDFVTGLGIDRVFNMQLKGGLKPIIKDPKRPRETAWDAISLMKMSYGYAVEIAPIHTLVLYNAVANGGVMVAPHLVTEIQENSRTVEKFGTEVINPKICSPKTLALVHGALKGVVENGTGQQLKNDNYTLAGKTGTAQVAMKNRGYMDSKGGREYLATFVGYFPADNPKYTCIVAIKTYHGPGSRNTYYGASLSLPAFKAIADRVYALDDSWQPRAVTGEAHDTIPVKGGNVREIYTAAAKLEVPTTARRRDKGWAVTAPDSAQVDVTAVFPKRDTIPSVVGMGLKDALFMLERQGLKVKFTGKGTVTEQSIPAGTPVGHGEQVTLRLAVALPQESQTTRRQ